MYLLLYLNCHVLTTASMGELNYICVQSKVVVAEVFHA